MSGQEKYPIGSYWRDRKEPDIWFKVIGHEGPFVIGGRSGGKPIKFGWEMIRRFYVPMEAPEGAI